MNKTIIDNWNNVVDDCDNVYLLGDVSFMGLYQTWFILEQLKGHKHLIAGNHDNKFRNKTYFKNNFVWLKDYHELQIDGQHIVICHYPMLSWNRSRYGSWMVHGHCHGALQERNIKLKRHDSGVDVNDFKPQSFQQIKEIMADKPAVDIDG